MSVDRLTKSSRNSMIFGVAGGMADFFDMDPTIMRVIFVLIALVTGGTAILAYIILAVVMPNEDGEENGERRGARTSPRVSGRRRNALAIILVVAGILALFANFGFFRWLDWGVLWPVFLIAVGLAIIAFRFRRV